MNEVLEYDGVKLLYDNTNNYYLQYDAGELMVKIKRIKITQEEAKRILNDPSESYNIIIHYQDRGIFGEND